MIACGEKKKVLGWSFCFIYVFAWFMRLFLFSFWVWWWSGITAISLAADKLRRRWALGYGWASGGARIKEKVRVRKRMRRGWAGAICDSRNCRKSTPRRKFLYKVCQSTSTTGVGWSGNAFVWTIYTAHLIGLPAPVPNPVPFLTAPRPSPCTL